MSVAPDPFPRSSADPAPTGTTSDLPPTTGDDEVDQILAEFASVGVDPPQAQVDAAEAAHRRLQARLSSP